MTMNNKNIIFFIGGTVLGALAGVFGTRTYFDKKYGAMARESLEIMEEEYQRRLENNYIPVKTVKEESEGQEQITAETREALLRNHEGTNYAAVYGKLHPDSSHKNAHLQISRNILGNEITVDAIEDEEDPLVEFDETIAHVEEAVARHEANKGRKPRLISARAVHELPDEIDISELQFYTEDEVLADGDTEEKIHDVARLVGDCLQKYDFVNSDERTIYVMNDELDTCYEVVKINASYEETHM